MDEVIRRAFMVADFNDGTLGRATWLGRQIWKTPCDLWLYQEVLWDVKPQRVIECGTYEGGTAQWLASVLEHVGGGEVMTIDIDRHAGVPKHRRLTYQFGSTVSEETVTVVRDWIGGAQPVMVILDSDHQAAHVLKELDLYAPLVTVGSYIVVEDTHIGHPWKVPGIERGPAEALADWLPLHPEFEVDRARDKYSHSVCTGGFLRRIA